MVDGLALQFGFAHINRAFDPQGFGTLYAPGNEINQRYLNAVVFCGTHQGLYGRGIGFDHAVVVFSGRNDGELFAIVVDATVDTVGLQFHHQLIGALEVHLGPAGNLDLLAVLQHHVRGQLGFVGQA